MSEETTDDNKSTEADNKATEEQNLPSEETEVEPEKETEPQDPEMRKWIEETKDLPNAYKRIQGSREEVDRWKKEAEEAKKQQDQMQQQLAQELIAYKQKDPESFEKLFGNVTPQQAAKEQVQVDPQQIARQAAVEARAQIEVENFYQHNKDHIKSDEEWQHIQDIALSFVGKIDREGNPYTINSALRDSMLIRYPELVGDQAISQHLTSQAKRASASESGDMPGGSASDDGLGEEYDQVAEAMGVRLTPEMKQRIAQRQRQ